MTLDATSPADSDLVSTLAERDREERAAINVLEASVAALGAVASVTQLELTAGATSMAISTHLSALRWEIVLLTATGACAIAEITGGTQGQLKIFILLDSDVTFTRDPTKIALNQPASITNFGGYTGDVIAFVNIGGNPATSTNGYWKEIWRTPLAY